MQALCIGLAIGVTLLQQQAALLEVHTLFLMLFAAVLLMLAGYRFSIYQKLPAVVRVLCQMLFAGIVGFVWASLFAHFYLTRSLPAKYEGKDLVVVGTIDSLPAYFDQGERFNFVVEHVISPDLSVDEQRHFPEKLALSAYQSTEDLHVRPGERWQFNLRLKRPHGSANPHGFDYEVWLLEQGIRATGTVRPASSSHPNQRLQAFVWSFGNVVERCRAMLRDRIHTALPGKAYAGVIVALVIGDQREISQSDWTVFNRAGIGHLISISGLHITMIAGLFAGLISFLWRHSFFLNLSLPLMVPAQKVAALAGAVIAFLYVALAGFGVPAQRTLYMLCVVALAVWNGRVTSFSSVLCLALGLVVVLDPWAVLSPGFWLSFGAVGVILFAAVGVEDGSATTRRQQLASSLRVATRTQYAVTVGLVPLTMFLFGQFSLISPLANAVAIPLISFVVTPLALLGSVLPSGVSVLLLSLAHETVQMLATILSWLSTFPAAVWTAAYPPFWVFALALAGVVWMLLPKAWPMRWLGIFCCLPLISHQSVPVADGQLRVTALDVGQGMALLIETSAHRLLYDTGPAYSAESDSGSRIILPYLKAQGINGLDAMIVSHNDSDHSGGALSILRQMPVSLVLSSLNSDSAIVAESRQHRRCQSGQTWRWDGVLFEILQPVAASYDSTKWKPNARSCVLKVSTSNDAMLLPGDIEAVQEDELVNSIPDKLRANVLLAPHHGSGTSSTPAFLQAVRPELAIFQLGYLNRYHHPKTEVWNRYADFGIKRLRTDESGAITLQFGTSLQFSQFRQEHARYWYAQ
jgi:competence protein ComEC